ncbi:MAG: hypothetical protein IJE77_09985 [Thermoguttaceae bacterium]|nr:hypothetical protein [Thermoguttaceae bacterium]
MRTTFSAARLLVGVALAAFFAVGSTAPPPAFAQNIYSIYSAFNGPDAPIPDGKTAEDVENYVGPSDFLLDKAGTYFYVAEGDAGRLRRVRADGTANAESIPLPFKPNKMRFFPGETKIAIVGGGHQGRLAIVEIAQAPENAEADAQTVPTPLPLRVVADYPIGHTPSDVSVKRTAAGRELVYATLQFEGAALEIDAATGKVERRWDVGREPFCAELTPDGRRYVVAGRITDKRANVSYSCSAARVIDLETGEVKKTDFLNGHNLLTDMTLSPDGKFAFISAVQGNYLSVTSQVSGGWIAENVFLVVDVETCEFVEVFFLDDEQLGAGNPWGIACSEDGKRLVVSLAGTDEIVFIPLERVMKTLADRPEWARPGFGAYMYSSFATGEVQLPIRLRVKFGLKGLRQTIVRGDDVYVLSYFEDAICKATLKLTPPFEYYPNSYVSLETPPRLLQTDANANPTAAETSENADSTADRPDDSAAEAAAFAKLAAETASNPNAGPPLRFVELEPRRPLKGVEIARSFARLAPKPTLTTRRRGEILYHDATACFEHWQSCVTCHPDARVDGFNWDLLNDGTGNLKNSKSMLLSHETPPSMISGIRADAETAVRAGFTHILFKNADEENACAVDEYLSSLRPVPSPYLVDGELSESAKRGKILFESDRTGCAICHPAPHYTDLRLHRVGSQDVNDFIDAFDSPTLIEVWRTAPYMNTGEYLTVRELLLEGKHGARDGRLDKLTPQEQDDLIEYVLSL